MVITNIICAPRPAPRDHIIRNQINLITITQSDIWREPCEQYDNYAPIALPPPLSNIYPATNDAERGQGIIKYGSHSSYKLHLKAKKVES